MTETNYLSDTSSSTVIGGDFRAKWKCPIHAAEGVPSDIVGFCYTHDTYICQDCAYDHMMCESRQLLIDLQKKIVLDGENLKNQVIDVKKDYELRLEEVKKMRDLIVKDMGERINFFNKLVEEIKKAMQDHCDNVQKELDLAVDSISYFPRLCELNLRILDALAKKCDYRKIDPDVFKRFCTSFDKELGSMQVPIGRLELQTKQIQTSANHFSAYVSKAGMPIKLIRDQIVFSSKIQNKQFIENILKDKFDDKSGKICLEDCQKTFLEIIASLNLYIPPSNEDIDKAFNSYQILDANNITEGIAMEVIMKAMQELQEYIKGPEVLHVENSDSILTDQVESKVPIVD